MSDDWSYLLGYIACAVALTASRFFEMSMNIFVSVAITLVFGLIEIQRQAKK